MVRVPVGSNQRLFHRSACSFNEDEYLADNPDYVFDCSSMSASRMLFQRANTIKLHYICLYIVERIEMQIAPAIWYSCENSSFGVKQHLLAQYAWNKVNVKTRTGPCLWFCFSRAWNVGRSKHGTRYGSRSVVFYYNLWRGYPLSASWCNMMITSVCWALLGTVTSQISHKHYKWPKMSMWCTFCKFNSLSNGMSIIPKRKRLSF